MAKAANPTTVTFGTSGFVFNNVEYSFSYTRESLESTGLADSGAREYFPAGIYDADEFTFSGNYTPSSGNTPPINEDAEPITVVQGGGGTDVTKSFTGFMVQFTETANHGGQIEGSGTIKITGAITTT
jgi:hypothetical protein